MEEANKNNYPPTVKNRYLWHYKKFLKLEIPNFLQIMTLIGFFSVFNKNRILIFLIPFLIFYLLFTYHIYKFGEYINDQIKDPYSDMKAYDMDPDKYPWERYIIITDIILFCVMQTITIFFRFYS